MKKILCTLIICLCCITLVCGQNFKPGQQAQGMLESKNVTVDYATGTFHYHVPVYTLKSGDYELPITLDYTARGVRVDDRPGLLGYNWTLNTGGVVTRTVRGGIADEFPSKGFIHAERAGALIDEEQFVKDVDQRIWDGESDLFTAVFANRSVSFIIRYDSLHNKISAYSLEDNSVKIEPLGDINSIDGWIITDELGNRYIYGEFEVLQQVREDGPVSFNGIRHQAYRSSWYMTRIEPVHERPIEFRYASKPLDDEFNSYSLVYYQYGNSVADRSFDFGKYEPEFNRYINLAKAEIQASVFLVDIPTSLYDFEASRGTMEQYMERWLRPQWTDMSWFARNEFQIMGMLSNPSRLAECWYEMYMNLERTITYYKSFDNRTLPNGYLIRSYLKGAKGILETCIRETELVDEKITNQGCSYQIGTPCLQSIMCGDREIVFSYRNKKLERITLLDALKRQVSSVCFSSDKTLSRVGFLGKDNEEVSHLRFSYYSEPANGHDWWGYAKQMNGEWNFFDPGISPECMTNGTLQSIRLSDGGYIHLVYEPNTVQTPTYYPQGGFRIKEMVLSDDTYADTIRYHYPEKGVQIFETLEYEALITCKNSMDKIRRSLGKMKGCPLANTGNNGVYYPFVLEELPHRGWNAYWFAAMPGVVDYRMNGVIQGKASYSSDGHLLQLFCYDYSMEDKRVPFLADKFLLQVEADEYAVDEQALESYYKGLNPVYMPVLGSFEPYRDYYLPNIAPHLPKGKNSGDSYLLYYGGKPVLCGLREYHFSDVMVPVPSVSDLEVFSKNMPYRQQFYYYEAPDETFLPTRTIQIDSRGDTLCTQTTYVTMGLSTVSQKYEAAKERNLRNYPLVESSYFNGRLQEKRIFHYGFPQGNTQEPLMLDSVELYVDSLNTPLQTIRYVHQKQYGGYRTVEARVDNNVESFVYDALGEHKIFQSNSAHFNEVAAIDHRRQVENLIDSLSYDDTLLIRKDTLYLEHLPADGRLLIAVLSHSSFRDMQLGLLGTSYVLECADGTVTTGTIDYHPTNSERLHWLVLDLSAYPSPSRLTILCGAFVNYMAVMPLGTSFEATSYNADGTVYARFDGEGHGEIYDYDRACRVMEVKDITGKRISSHFFNVKQIDKR